MCRPVSYALVVLMASTACSEPTPLPRSPTSASAVPSVSPDATSIGLGQVVTGTVTLADKSCEPDFPGDPPEPCQRFAIAISTSGVLTARVTSAGPSALTLRVGPEREWGVTDLSTATGVAAGSTYEIAVALHDAVGGNTSQAFELTTSLTPR